MIENREYVGPYSDNDQKTGVRSWSSFAGPPPEDILPSWRLPIPDELPHLVEPGPLTDPALVEVIGDAG